MKLLLIFIILPLSVLGSLPYNPDPTNDLDADGLYDCWETNWFGSTNVWDNPWANPDEDQYDLYTEQCFDSGEHNPTTLIADFDNLDSSPWFYECINDFLQTLAENHSFQAGEVYEFAGNLINYELQGNIKCLLEYNLR